MAAIAGVGLRQTWNLEPDIERLTQFSQVMSEDNFQPRADLREGYSAAILDITRDIGTRLQTGDFRGCLERIASRYKSIMDDGFEVPSKEEVSINLTTQFGRPYGVLRSSALNFNLEGAFLARICDYTSAGEKVKWEDDTPPSAQGGWAMGALWEQDVELTRFHTVSISENKLNKVVSIRLENIPFALEECEAKFNKILYGYEQDEAGLSSQIAEFHWWLLQASPYAAGNSECAAIFVAALWNHKRIQVQPWKEGASVYLEALTTPRQEFVSKYASFRE